MMTQPEKPKKQNLSTVVGSLDKRVDPFYYYFIFAITLILHMYFSTIGWGNTECGHHGFRRCQTAITSYYALKEGFKLAYITPVMGMPWAIPMEFPLYQWISAAFAGITRLPLIQSGRIISLFSFYLLLIPVYLTLSRILAKRYYAFIFLSLILSCPVYIFWSRCFMIESTALMLCVMFLFFLIRYTQKPSLWALAWASAYAILGGLVKITTLAVYFFPAAAILFRQFMQADKGFKTYMRAIMICIILCVIPLTVGYLWIHYTDSIKEMNPIGAKLSSAGLSAWNFGDISAKLSLNTWLELYKKYMVNIFGPAKYLSAPVFLIILTMAAVLNKKYRGYSILSLASFIFPMVLFTNLFYVHDYYWYSNAIWLLLFTGFFISFLAEKPLGSVAVKYIILPGMIFCMYQAYFSVYYDIQRTDDTRVMPIAETIAEYTGENDVLLIYGYDWAPEIPLYSGRKALMIPRWVPSGDPRIAAALNKLKGGAESVKAVIIPDDTIPGDPYTGGFIQRHIDEFDLYYEPIGVYEIPNFYSDYRKYKLYISRDAGK